MTAEVLYLPADRERALELAVKLILEGELVILPTETIYGLTCDAKNAGAVGRLFAIKGRELDKPSAVFVADKRELERVAAAERPEVRAVIERFLPGPLTVVLKSRLPETAGVVGGDGKIGIRISSDSFVTELAARTGRLLIATSANLSGKPDCRTQEELLSQFANQVSLIILRDSNPAATASTVVDLTGTEPRLVREGTIPLAEVLKAQKEISDV